MFIFLQSSKIKHMLLMYGLIAINDVEMLKQHSADVQTTVIRELLWARKGEKKDKEKSQKQTDFN